MGKGCSFFVLFKMKYFLDSTISTNSLNKYIYRPKQRARYVKTAGYFTLVGYMYR